MKLEKSSFFNEFVANINSKKSFTLTGLTSFSRLLLLKYIKQISSRKILFITSTEQSALRYSTDLERLFSLDSKILPYQSISLYETLAPNIYDYQKQVDILRNLPDIVIAPAKVLLEKMPRGKFFEENRLNLKVGDSITQQELLKKLVSFGY